MSTAVCVLIALFALMFILMMILLLHRRAHRKKTEMKRQDGIQVQNDPQHEPDEDTSLESDDMKNDEFKTDDDLLFDQDILKELLGDDDDGGDDVDFADIDPLPSEDEEPAFAADDSMEEPEEEPAFAACEPQEQNEEPGFADLSEEPKEEPDFTEDIDLFPHPLLEYEEDDDVSLLRQGVRIAWPESDVMMVSAAFGSSVLYIWEGNANKDDLILFDVHEKELGYPLLETAKRISDAYIRPGCRFAFLIHTDDKDLKKSRNDAAAFLRSTKRTPSLVISDYAQQYEESGALSGYELIAVGSRPYVYLTSDAAKELSEGIVDLTRKSFKPDEINETALDAYERMKNSLSAYQRAKARYGFSEKRIARKAADKIPETAAWTMPQFKVSKTANGSAIRLSAPDEKSLEKALALLSDNMRRNGHTFRIVESQKESAPATIYDEAFIRMEEAYENAGIDRILIPVLSEEDYTFKGIRTLSFASKRMKRRDLDRLLMSIINCK